MYIALLRVADNNSLANGHSAMYFQAFIRLPNVHLYLGQHALAVFDF
jgi:hypothetical protein